MKILSLHDESIFAPMCCSAAGSSRCRFAGFKKNSCARSTLVFFGCNFRFGGVASGPSSVAERTAVLFFFANSRTRKLPEKASSSFVFLTSLGRAGQGRDLLVYTMPVM